MEIPTHWICLREHLKTGNPYDMGFYRWFPVKIFPTDPIKIDPTLDEDSDPSFLVPFWLCSQARGDTAS